MVKGSSAVRSQRYDLTHFYLALPHFSLLLGFIFGEQLATVEENGEGDACRMRAIATSHACDAARRHYSEGRRR